MKTNKDFYPNALEEKILATIYFLNQENYYPNSEGIFKILKGIVDDETIQFRNCPTFSILISANKKKITLRSSLLIRHGFLKYKYCHANDILLYELSDFGKIFIMDLLKKKKKTFTKKVKSIKPSIIKID